jgi:hypothetical protein
MAQSPFPGMDPYLEAPELWPDVHNRLMNLFAEQLGDLLAPKYIAELDTQIVIDRFPDEPESVKRVIPDVAITQPRMIRESSAESTVVVAPLRLRVPIAIQTRLVSLYIRLQENKRLVAVIELPSAVNKRPGEGRQAYLEKRTAYLETAVHLIEIDLLRKSPRMPLEGKLPESDYLAMVCNMYERPNCDVWPISVRGRLPNLPIPLLRPDPPVDLDLNQALRTAYRRAHYDLRIDYRAPCDSPLAPADAEWAEQLLDQTKDE